MCDPIANAAESDAERQLANPSPSAGEEHFEPWLETCTLTDGAPLGLPSTYDASTMSFKHDVTVESDCSYCLTQYIITAGPMKGRRALVLVPAGSFRLLDLPLEIRHMIYGYFLTRQEPIRLKRYVGRLVQQSFNPNKGKLDVWDAELRKWKSRERHLLAITGVNKQIHHEAAAFLYSTNRFVFQDPQTLSLLSKLAGVGIHHLRHLELARTRGDTTGHLAAALNVLKECASLRSLTLPHSTICTNIPDSHRAFEDISAHALVDACLPLLFKIQRTRNQKHIMGSVLDVVSSTQCDCARCNEMLEQPNRRSVHCDCKNLGAMRDEEDKFWTTFKEVAGKRLLGKNKLNIGRKQVAYVSRTLDSMWQRSRQDMP